MQMGSSPNGPIEPDKLTKISNQLIKNFGLKNFATCEYSYFMLQHDMNEESH